MSIPLELSRVLQKRDDMWSSGGIAGTRRDQAFASPPPPLLREHNCVRQFVSFSACMCQPLRAPSVSSQRDRSGILSRRRGLSDAEASRAAPDISESSAKTCKKRCHSQLL